MKPIEKNKMKTIYQSSETWDPSGDFFYFTEEYYDHFMDSFLECICEDRDTQEIDLPAQLFYEKDDGLYYSADYYHNFGRKVFKLIDDSDLSDIKMEIIRVDK